MFRRKWIVTVTLAAFGVVGRVPSARACQSDAECNDGNACTFDWCSGGGFFGGGYCQHSMVQCYPDNCHPNAWCDPAVGCVAPPRCDDGIACTQDQCNPADGSCTYVPDAAACDDGDACTADACDLSAGCTHTAVSCDDGVACTVDACNPATGCSHTADNTLCDDGLPCTADACDAVVDCTHTPDDAACADGVPCTSDACVPGTGCTHTPNQAACDDGWPCTSDVCDPTAGC